MARTRGGFHGPRSGTGRNASRSDQWESRSGCTHPPRPKGKNARFTRRIIMEAPPLPYTEFAETPTRDRSPSPEPENEEYPAAPALPPPFVPGRIEPFVVENPNAPRAHGPFVPGRIKPFVVYEAPLEPARRPKKKSWASDWRMNPDSDRRVRQQDDSGLPVKEYSPHIPRVAKDAQLGHGAPKYRARGGLRQLNGCEIEVTGSREIRPIYTRYILGRLSGDAVRSYNEKTTRFCTRLAKGPGRPVKLKRPVKCRLDIRKLGIFGAAIPSCVVGDAYTSNWEVRAEKEGERREIRLQGLKPTTFKNG
ncbi:hypothetical protein B0H17DRAFT_1150686 [Mycena rosella]|uniref:Uncharacterized protein n=1 Tax=Mycena rosella TaxID=1033263 RepID=A0AAD7BQY1_MYCRO|nr:hypothetical protein B0H17DRAFT_1150686 [Mycena rosella]